MRKEDIVKTINEKYKDYQGYVQFSHHPIDKSKDIFYDGKEVVIKDEEGFIYEAHFFNGTISIAIKQINDNWLISTTPIKGDEDTKEYVTDIKEFNYKIKMAQIWEAKPDPLCENMEVLKLQKVVFAGFENG